MYSGSGFSDWEIGDITVIIHKGVYHLFHLIIPNHDYIAHAVSNDGMSWRRVENALFVGNPGEWDDDMLWTMDIYASNELFEMYYTGLQRKDRGKISRVGLAISGDLVHWEKVNNNIFPFESKGPYYETLFNNPRNWLSFRDPYRFDHDGKSYFLICARACEGPTSRRGCVGLVEKKDDKLEYLPPLLNPLVYDDIECPCVFELNERFYLLGSIREDIKVRYWFSDDFRGEYHSFHADVILPQGNYAARVVKDGEHLLIYHFYFANGKIDALRVLPPPKQLDTDSRGRLTLKSYYRWDKIAFKPIHQIDFNHPDALFKNPTAAIIINQEKWTLTSKSGYELCCFNKPSDSFIWEGEILVEGMGKLGLVCDTDADGNGYYISLDVANGVVQIRAWGYNAGNDKSNFIFNNLQNHLFTPNSNKNFYFKLIRYGHYIELSIDGIVKLSLIDYTYIGPFIGIYSASSSISLQQSVLRSLPDPANEYASQENTILLENP